MKASQHPPAPRRLRHVAHTVAVLLLAGAPAALRAAAPLDDLLERHRARIDDGRAASFDWQVRTPDGAAAWAGSTRVLNMPTASFTSAGSGVRAQKTWLDDAKGWRVKLGVAASEHGRGASLPGFTLEGSEISHPLGAGRAYLSQERRHWGPGWAGSLLLDGSLPAMSGIGWRKTDASAPESPWLSWAGPWGADVFIAGLAGHEAPARPWMIGMRLALRPLEGLEIGLARAMQWGGRGRDESARSLWRGLVGNDNVEGGGLNGVNEPGNQLAGIDLRYEARLNGNLRSGAYLQAIGEDEAGGLPYKFLTTGGLELSGRFSAAAPAELARATWRTFIEASDTGMGHAFGLKQPGAYRHSVYQQGYTHFGQVIGHPVGGDAEIVTLGGMVKAAGGSAMVMLNRGRALSGSQLFDAGQRLRGGSAALTVPLKAGWRAGASVASLSTGATRQHQSQAWLASAW